MPAREIVELAWTQVWQLAALVLIVWATVRWLAKDRPHLAHALWLVVLLKCVTPPIWSSPAGAFSWLQRDLPTVGVDRPQPSAPTILEAAESEVPSAIDTLPGHAAAENRNDSAPTVRPPRLPAVTTLSDTPPQFDRWHWLLVVWLGGAIFFFAGSAVRFGFFTFRLSRYPAGDHAEVTACVRRLSRQLAIRRRVRAVVTDSRIGPAVVGWRRPTILLPSVVVEGKSAVELEPLVAHELIHVRRGDLVWATAQAIATSLWWFHPLVWIASRMLTREAERSCDEEVVAGLGCQPAVYARGLLDVLERKHRLHCAPSLPGVRAVDITSSRLERIMQLGQGSHRRTPWWCWVLAVAVAAVALPGAALKSAEESKPLAAVVDTPPAPPLPKSEDALVSPFIARIDVSDLLQRLAAERGLEDEQAALELASLVAPGPLDDPTSESAQRSILITIPSGGQVRKLKLAHPGVRIVDNTLYLFDSSERRQQVRKAVERLREHGFQRLTISARFVSAAPGELEKLWSKAKPADGRSPDAGLADAGSSPFYLREAQLSQFLSAAQANSRVNLFQLPPITVFNGERAASRSLKKRPFVIGLEPARDENDERTGDFKPIIRVVEEGTRLTLRPVLGEDERVQLECSLIVSEVRNVETAEIPQGSNGGAATIQVPEVTSRTLATVLEVPLGQAVVINGFRQRSVDGNQTAMLVLLTCVAETSDDSRVVIQGPTVQIGGVRPSGPPTDDELTKILLRRNNLDESERHAIEQQAGSMHIRKEKIADYFDPVRVGEDGKWLRRHHTHYKCIFNKSAFTWRADGDGDASVDASPLAIRPSDSAKQRVLYIDHIHDYVVSAEAPPAADE